MTYHCNRLGRLGTEDMTFTSEEAVQESYAAGVAALQASRNAEALELLRAAYMQDPRAEILVSIGIAQQRLKRFADAQASFQRYLSAEPSGSLVAEARRHIAEMQAPGLTADQIAATAANVPPTLRGSAMSTKTMLLIGGLSLLGFGGLFWAVTRARR